MKPLLLSIDEVGSLLKLKRRAMYSFIARFPDFPAPVQLSQRCVRYRAADVEAFVAGLPARPIAVEPARLRLGRARRRGNE